MARIQTSMTSRDVYAHLGMQVISSVMVFSAFNMITSGHSAVSVGIQVTGLAIVVFCLVKASRA